MIEKQQEKAIATKKENLPSTLDLESMEGQGNEFVTARDTKLPTRVFIRNKLYNFVFIVFYYII